MGKTPSLCRMGLAGLAALALPCAPAPARPAAGPTLVYVGTRLDGPGQGISALRLDPATGALSAIGLASEAVRPTWLLASPDHALLYAVSETGNDGTSEASVASYAIDRASGRLTQTARVGSGGGGATFLALAPARHPRALLVANYGGSVAVLPLAADGAPRAARAVIADPGHGPLPRQASAHPHGIALAPDRHSVFVADLGADRVFVDRYDPLRRRLAGDPAGVAVPPGSGPRHVVAAGRFVYVNNELTGTIAIFSRAAGRGGLTLLRNLQTSRGAFSGEMGEIALAPGGHALYVSSRGADELIVYAIDPRSGDLAELQRLSSGGASPVTFAADPGGRWLLVANEASGTVDEFAIGADGRLAATGRALHMPRPASLAMVPAGR